MHKVNPDILYKVEKEYMRFSYMIIPVEPSSRYKQNNNKIAKAIRPKL